MIAHKPQKVQERLRPILVLPGPYWHQIATKLYEELGRALGITSDREQMLEEHIKDLRRLIDLLEDK